MLEGLNTAAAGMAAQQQRIDAVANDLANANTPATSTCASASATCVYERRRGRSVRPGRRARAPAPPPSTPAAPSTRARCSGPTSRSTSRIQGEGFLRVKLADGPPALTRDGALHVDGTGRLVTSSGALVQPAISVPAGTDREPRSRSARTAPSPPRGRSLGKLDARHRPLATGRSSRSATTSSSTTAASGAAVAAPAATTAHPGRARGLQHRHVATRWSTMIESQRAYQLTSKAIQTADQMMEIANGVKR